jgi:phospholipase/carboxylesterase
VHTERLGLVLCLAAIAGSGEVACSRRSTPGEAAASVQSDAATQTAQAATVPRARAIALPPKQGPPSCLVVLLHGYGADADSFQAVGRALGDRLPRAEMLVPDGLQPWEGGGTGRMWFSLGDAGDRAAHVHEAGAEVSRWIDDELAARHLGGDHLALVGFSQGAMLTAWLAVHRTPRPAAAVMLSGLVAEDQSAPPGPSATLPILVAHGDRDVRIPVTVVEESARILGTWGAQVTTRDYAGLGHEVGGIELREVGDFLAAAL